MPHTIHSSAGEYCEACGQRIVPPLAYGEGPSLSKRIGIGLSVALHLLAVLYYFVRSPEPVRRAPPSANEGAMVYITPPGKSKPKPKSQSKPVELAKAKPVPRQPKAVAAVTPARRKEEVFVPPVVSPMAAPITQNEPPKDMFAGLEAKRRARGQVAPDEAPQESEAERANRIARVNIAGAQGRNSGNDRNDTGGIFSILDQTSYGARIKFRGWNGNFNRTWNKDEPVELGLEPDIETAIVKKMMELIRKEKPGDFIWESHRLGRQVPLSARVEDTAELQAFLLKEFFPNYRRRAR